jgi:hypothetical protein
MPQENLAFLRVRQKRTQIGFIQKTSLTHDFITGIFQQA